MIRRSFVLLVALVPWRPAVAQEVHFTLGPAWVSQAKSPSDVPTLASASNTALGASMGFTDNGGVTGRATVSISRRVEAELSATLAPGTAFVRVGPTGAAPVYEVSGNSTLTIATARAVLLFPSDEVTLAVSAGGSVVHYSEYANFTARNGLATACGLGVRRTLSSLLALRLDLDAYFSQFLLTVRDTNYTSFNEQHQLVLHIVPSLGVQFAL